jgi:hypothetical protein
LSNPGCIAILTSILDILAYGEGEMILKESVLTSEEAFEIMNRFMPGEEAIRVPLATSEEIQKDEANDFIKYLHQAKNSYFMKEFDFKKYYKIRARINRLISDLEKCL